MADSDLQPDPPLISADDFQAPIPIVPDDQVYLDVGNDKLYAVVRSGELIWNEPSSIVDMSNGHVKEISYNGEVVFREDEQLVDL